MSDVAKSLYRYLMARKYRLRRFDINWEALGQCRNGFSPGVYWGIWTDEGQRMNAWLDKYALNKRS